MMNEPNKKARLFLNYPTPSHDRDGVNTHSFLCVFGGGSQRRAADMSGFALVSAIFLMVVLSLIGMGIATLSQSQSKTSGLDIMGEYGYQAAQSGLEWGLYMTRSTHACAASNLAGLQGEFTSTVTCTATTATEGVNSDGSPHVIAFYEINVVSCNQPSGGTCPNNAPPEPADYVERRIRGVTAL